MGFLQLIFKYFIAHFKGQAEYRFAFVMDLIVNIFIYGSTVLGMWIILDRFQVIQGWTFYEVMILFNLNLLAFALSSFFFYHPMHMLGVMIREGSFDLILVKPLNPFVHMLVRQYAHPYLGHMILASVMLSISFSHLNIHWTIMKVFFLGLDLIGAALIISALWVATGALSFWIVKVDPLIETFVYNIREAINYPISIYGKAITVLLTFGIPYAFISFYPAQYLLDGKGETLFHPVLQYGTPVVGIVMFLLAYKFWTIGVNRYESTGS